MSKQTALALGTAIHDHLEKRYKRYTEMANRDDDARLTELPEEVKEHLGPVRASQPRRVACYPCGKVPAKGSAWSAARAYGRTIGVAEEHEYTGWRSCHLYPHDRSKGYWIWWAQDVEPLQTLAAVAAAMAKLEEVPTADEAIEAAWEVFLGEIE